MHAIKCQKYEHVKNNNVKDLTKIFQAQQALISNKNSHNSIISKIPYILKNRNK
jgi:hypothetical protein